MGNTRLVRGNEALQYGSGQELIIDVFRHDKMPGCCEDMVLASLNVGEVMYDIIESSGDRVDGVMVGCIREAAREAIRRYKGKEFDALTFTMPLGRG